MTEDQIEKFCIAFGWCYGTALDREHMRGEPDDGLTPQKLWDHQTDEDREFMRRIARETFAMLIDAFEP